MPVVTVRAADSATAMDEIIRRLGPDAMILSTRARDGQVEIVATDEVIPVPARTRRPETPVEVPDQPAEPEPEAFTVPGWAAGFAAHLAHAIGTPPNQKCLPNPPRPRRRWCLCRPWASHISLPRFWPPPASFWWDRWARENPPLPCRSPRRGWPRNPMATAPRPASSFCGTGSQCDGAYLSQRRGCWGPRWALPRQRRCWLQPPMRRRLSSSLTCIPIRSPPRGRLWRWTVRFAFWCCPSV